MSEPRAYQMGRHAFHAGKRRTENPFLPGGDDCRSQWDEGWRDAKHADETIRLPAADGTKNND